MGRVASDTASGLPRRVWRRIATALDNIKFAHTVFALPFCLLAFGAASYPGPTPRLLGLVVLAMVCARTAAMSYNRYADAAIDAANPRTRGRPVPSGRMTRRETLAWTVVSALAFVAVAGLINAWALALAPVALLVILGYSHSKRFTWLSHVWLGLALSIAPMGGWIAAGGMPWDLPPLLIAAAVVCWVAGFDVIYATQDHAFDRAHGLHSAVVRFGVGRALLLARLLHLGAVAALVATGLAGERLGLVYYVGVALAALCLLWEHSLVRPDDLSRVDVAFFTMNGIVSLVLCAAGLADIYLL